MGSVEIIVSAKMEAEKFVSKRFPSDNYRHINNSCKFSKNSGNTTCIAELCLSIME